VPRAVRVGRDARSVVATLPEPNLPPEIKRRARRVGALEDNGPRARSLLERGANIEVPVGIAQDVLALSSRASRGAAGLASDALSEAR
jgi:hypothetical protein